ncbi:AAA family ATPase [Cellulomonas wangsupingiae]|uniref:AAA family ATPase n=1 Tax=Cellulomonas wangsupingiae TaxID=2968085 RepID=UPI001D0EE1AB|nr:AAA family ATPase [Cellulomonas wangsupingiae]MCM0638676.1 AAA family ATPase [Cellulomonas wangsupingiae]
MTPPLRRVRVVGTSGSGKTTFARRLARALGAPHVELDEVFWGPGWVKRDLAEAHADLRARTAGPAWVADGNWESQLGDLLDGADAVVWLDHPRRTVMARVVRRALRRGILREELWHGNRESLANLLHLDPDQNIVLWSWTSHRRVAARYAARADDPRMVRLRGPRQAEAWLRAVERGSAR